MKREKRNIKFVSDEQDIPEAVNSTKITNFYYGGGTNSEVLPDVKVCARVIQIPGGRPRYLLKLDQGELFNPVTHLMTYHKREWKFIPVNETAFKLYLKFLETKKEYFKTKAERECNG